jgi:hypothetical protein
LRCGATSGVGTPAAGATFSTADVILDDLAEVSVEARAAHPAELLAAEQFLIRICVLRRFKRDGGMPFPNRFVLWGARYCVEYGPVATSTVMPVACRRLLDAFDVAAPPSCVADLVMVASRTAVDHFAEDVGVPCMLGCLGHNADKQRS